MRITEIMTPAAVANKSFRRLFYILAAIFAAPVAVAQISIAAVIANDVPSFTATPVDGRLTSSFGIRRDPMTKEHRQHKGVDIAAKTGTPVVAPAAGKVMRVQTLKGYGNLLTLDHGGGFVTRYGQLEAFEVKAGASVRAGQLIARVGSTGRSTGPHLHFELIREGEHVDPADYVPLPARKK